MIHAGFYVRNGRAYIPLTAKTQAGFYIDMEPVEIVSVSDGDALELALHNAVLRGNPVVPTPTRGSFPRPVVLKYAKVKSWRLFESQATYWSLSARDHDWTFGTWKRADRGWEPDPSAETHIEGDYSIDDIVRRLGVSVRSSA